MIPTRSLRTAPIAALVFALFGACADSAGPQAPPDDEQNPPPPPPGPADITLHPSVQYQTIVGWEAHNESGHYDVDDFESYSDDLFDLVVNEVGINRIRLEVRSGMENAVDIWTLYRAGQIDQEAFRCRRWEVVNDNGSPGSIDPAGFHFSFIDETIRKVIQPIRQKLAARGEQLYLNLTYVSFTRECSDNAAAHDTPQEYAEFILATFRHMQDTFGFVPDAVEIILEPDNVPAWSPREIGEAMVATGSLLEANGYRPDFIGPSTAGMHRAPNYFDQLIGVPGASNYIKELSYHRYHGEETANLAPIVARANQYGLRTAMLERLEANYEHLHEDLAVGNVSAWQQFAIAFKGTGAGGNVLIGVDFSGPTPQPFLPDRTKYLRQYFLYVRAGAVRIATGTTKPGFEPLAFVNADGRYTVVVKANQGGSFTVGDLPAGTYGIMYTTASESGVRPEDVKVESGGLLQASIPAGGVITIFAR